MRFFLVLVLQAAYVYARPESVTESLDQFDDEFHEAFLGDDEENEKAREAARLKVVEAKINEENAKFDKGEATFKERLYAFSGETEDELANEMFGVPVGNGSETRYMGLISPAESERFTKPEDQAHFDALYAKNRGYTPKEALNKNIWTKVKNQGNCGSCAAFASTGLHEMCMAKAGSGDVKNIDLSEQYIIDCGYGKGGMYGCKGAWPASYTKMFINKGGDSPHSHQYPYLGGNPKLVCGPAEAAGKWNSGAKLVSSHVQWGCDEEKMKKLVYETGSVAVVVYASYSGFSSYSSGVVNSCPPTGYRGKGKKQPNHAVLIVGYGTENGQDYWLVKNSWGKNWGANGHIKLARGSNQCGVAEMCLVANCEASGKQDPVPAKTKQDDDDIPTNLWCDLSKYSKWLSGYFNEKPFTLRARGPDGKQIKSYVRCKSNGMCTPAGPGPSNGCMYICGRLKC